MSCPGDSGVGVCVVALQTGAYKVEGSNSIDLHIDRYQHRRANIASSYTVWIASVKKLRQKFKNN